MRSIHSLARIGGLTQPRGASNPEDAKKENKDRPNAKKGERNHPPPEQQLRSRCVDRESCSVITVSAGLPSRAPSHHSRPTDDTTIPNQSYMYLGDPRAAAAHCTVLLLARRMRSL